MLETVNCGTLTCRSGVYRFAGPKFKFLGPWTNCIYISFSRTQSSIPAVPGKIVFIYRFPGPKVQFLWSLGKSYLYIVFPDPKFSSCGPWTNRIYISFSRTQSSVPVVPGQIVFIYRFPGPRVQFLWSLGKSYLYIVFPDPKFNSCGPRTHRIYISFSRTQSSVPVVPGQIVFIYRFPGPKVQFLRSLDKSYLYIVFPDQSSVPVVPEQIVFIYALSSIVFPYPLLLFRVHDEINDTRFL
jgi:hypothetical protein